VNVTGVLYSNSEFLCYECTPYVKTNLDKITYKILMLCKLRSS
jgi:hypothetical protein